MIALQVVSCLLCNCHPCELTAEPWCSALSLLHGELADSIWCNLLMEEGWVCIKRECVCLCVCGCVRSGQLAFKAVFVCQRQRKREGSAEVWLDSLVLPAMTLSADTLHLLLVRLTPRNTCARPGCQPCTNTNICASCHDHLILGWSFE